MLPFLSALLRRCPGTKILLLALPACLLSACAGLPPVQAPENWESHHAAVNAHDDWELQGRLNIRSENEARTMNLRWYQQAQDYEISLSGSLGIGSVRIQGDENSLVMEKSDEEQPYYADNLREVSSAWLGYEFPAAHILYWVRGIMAPDSPFKASYNEFALLEELHQDQWHIEYDRYREVDGVNMPGRIRMEHPPYRLTFLVSDWRLDAAPDVAERRP